MPLYRIEKDPALARKQGAYSVVAATGMILRRGNDLARVISVLDKAREIGLDMKKAPGFWARSLSRSIGRVDYSSREPVSARMNWNMLMKFR